MSNLKKNRGIVLRKTKYRESDLIIQMIFSNGEKVSLLARAALKSKKRFGGGILDPLNFIEVGYKDSGGERLAILEEASLLEDFSGLKADYDRMETALFCLSAITKVCQEGDHHSQPLFNLLGHALRTLEKIKDIHIFRTAFGLKLLFQQGVLEFEPWMNEFLKMPLQQLSENENDFEILPTHWQWIESRVASYLTTASNHSQLF